MSDKPRERASKKCVSFFSDLQVSKYKTKRAAGSLPRSRSLDIHSCYHPSMHAPFGRLVCPSLIGYLRRVIFSKSKHLEPSPSTMTWSPRNYFYDIYRIYLPPKDLSPSLNSNSQLATRHLIRDLNPRHLIWNFPLNNR